MKPNISVFSGVIFLSLLAMCMATAACQPGLIYGERSSLNIASVNLNDDVSEPVKIKIGFNRTLATSAPQRGGDDQKQMVTVPDGNGGHKEMATRGGEAVSVFSRFHLEYTKDNGPLPLVDNTLTITTNFASGQAGINISRDTEVVGALLRVRTVSPDTPDIVARKLKLTECVLKISDKTTLNAIANKLKTSVNVDDSEATKIGINIRISEFKSTELADAETSTEFSSCK